LDSLIFDVPGELVGSWRSLELGDDSFEKYSLARMNIRFKFILNMIKPGGRLLIGDERFFTKTYGKKLMNIFQL
jgi:hypothetical protein